MQILHILLSTQLLSSNFINLEHREILLSYKAGSQNRENPSASHGQKRDYSKEPLTSTQKEMIYNLCKFISEKPLPKILEKRKDKYLPESIRAIRKIHPEMLLKFMLTEMDKNLMQRIINDEEKLNLVVFFISQEIYNALPADELDSLVASICTEFDWDENIVKPLFKTKRFKELIYFGFEKLKQN